MTNRYASRGDIRLILLSSRRRHVRRDKRESHTHWTFVERRRDPAQQGVIAFFPIGLEVEIARDLAKALILNALYCTFA